MNYFKAKNRQVFLMYWDGEMQKKLFRCAKELGFYNKLKKTLSPDQVGLFMNLMDKIIDCDGRFASEAYVKGVFEGIAFHNKYC